MVAAGDKSAMPILAEASIQNRREATTGEMRRMLTDAVGLADRLEPRLARHEAWPHGLGDMLADFLDLFEDHMGREARWFGVREGGVLPSLTADHRALRERLQAVQEATRRLTAPKGACAEWMRLYALCRRLHQSLLARIQREDEALGGLPV